ncbi:hypothetical protein [Shimazuella kribbensis]|uniref:hypothetical protein n=1 Tax=Shimazuella kribbensis TaxID=139808 RepID=UPI0003FDB23B|nr:hypothetical protein [Shimazuella kribbensis]
MNNKNNLVTMFKKLPVERKAMIAETAVVAISWLAKKAVQSYQNRKNKKDIKRLEEKKESV